MILSESAMIRAPYSLGFGQAEQSVAAPVRPLCVTSNGY